MSFDFTYGNQMAEIQKRFWDAQFDASAQVLKQTENLFSFSLATSNVDNKLKSQLEELFTEGQNRIEDAKNWIGKALEIKGAPMEVSHQVLQLNEVAYNLALKNLSFTQEWSFRLFQQLGTYLPAEMKEQSAHYQNTIEKGLDYAKKSMIHQFSALRSAVPVEQEVENKPSKTQKRA